jgi:hypothetical protein
MSVFLGNLSIHQIQERLGIELTAEEVKFFESSWQERASDIDPNKWHCFDMPFMLACGSREFAIKVYGILGQYSDQMTTQLQVGVEGS